MYVKNKKKDNYKRTTKNSISTFDIYREKEKIVEREIEENQRISSVAGKTSAPG